MAYYEAACLRTLMSQVNAMAPNRSRASDGWIGDPTHQAEGSGSDHNPRGDTGAVCARDITHDPAGGLDAGVLAEKLAASRDPRIKYLIYNGRILDSRPGFSPWTWQRYGGDNPHTSHLHVSVHGDYDNPRAWILGVPNQEDDMTPEDRALLQECRNRLASMQTKGFLEVKSNEPRAAGGDLRWFQEQLTHFFKTNPVAAPQIDYGRLADELESRGVFATPAAVADAVNNKLKEAGN